jgi:signal-transduction protein with cAMP-binding, CBS, and nucleotidyltransferase domain
MVTKHKPHKFAKDQPALRQEISDYMSSPVMSVDADTSAEETARLMHDKNIGSLLVKEKDEYVGIVTETNLTRKVLGGQMDPKTTKISAIMSQPLLSMDGHLPVTDANAFMAKNKIRHLAVTENEKVVGMISVKDLVAFYANPRLR